eukprot:383370-Rhodomonas_salina.2
MQYKQLQACLGQHLETFDDVIFILGHTYRVRYPHGLSRYPHGLSRYPHGLSHNRRKGTRLEGSCVS